MIFCPNKYVKHFPDLNQEWLKIKGELSDKDAKLLLAQFLRHNLAFTVELISDIQLATYQVIALKAFFNREFCLCVWGRGCSKSFIAAVYCFLACIFEPNTKIVIAGPTFRTARNIFTELEKMVNNQKAKLLAQAFSTEAAHRNDLLNWDFPNGSSIKAIPLNGEKIRGFRANVLIIDEFLLITEDMIKNVLMPFLVAPMNIGERLQIKRIEDELIKSGDMKEEERTVFAPTAKMIALSSASYTFENLYTTYKEWLNKIRDEKSEITSRYFVSQIGYQAIPPEMVEKTVIEEASAGGLNNASFLREYCAQFTDGSEGYFSVKKMNECTIPDGVEPTLLLAGKKDKKYILAIDPNLSASPTADDFAMCLMEIDEEKQFGTVVHTYAKHGVDLKCHIDYFYYLIRYFNVVFIMVDNQDGQFIDSANGTPRFLDSGIQYNFILDWDDKLEDPEERALMLAQTKKNYNLQSRNICVSFLFCTNTIRAGNEHLQSCIDFKKVWFGSRLTPDGGVFDRALNTKIPLELTGFQTMGDLIDYQDETLNLTKKECALIEVKTNPQGNQTFDLPIHLKKGGKDRARRDSYTALMLANWGVRSYFEIMSFKALQIQTTFNPIFIR